MARNDAVGAARRVADGAEKNSVKSFVKSGSAAADVERGAGGAAGAANVVAVEAIGREQQRRAVAYSRSRGQL